MKKIIITLVLTAIMIISYKINVYAAVQENINDLINNNDILIVGAVESFGVKKVFYYTTEQANHYEDLHVYVYEDSGETYCFFAGYLNGHRYAAYGTVRYDVSPFPPSNQFEYWSTLSNEPNFKYSDTLYIYKDYYGINYTTYNNVQYIGNPFPPEPSWVDQAWDVVTDYFGFTGKPFSWITKLRDFWHDRFRDIGTFWDNLFHRDNNGNITTDMTVVSPTPIPAAPTPIPYNTFVEFDSQNNTYIYKYSYVDENNTTIIVTSPPDGGNGTGLRPTSEPIIDNYYPADPLDVPRDNNMWSPQFTINLGDGQTIDVDMNTLNDTIIQGAEPYVDNVDVASDMFSVIPTDWWMLIGFIACIPLICAIISRFLG